MATLLIREYEHVGYAPGTAGVPIAQEPGYDTTPLTFTTSSASVALQPTTRYVVISGSTDFHYKVGLAPTATTSMIKVVAGTMVFFAVPQGQSYKIAAVTA